MSNKVNLDKFKLMYFDSIDGEKYWKTRLSLVANGILTFIKEYKDDNNENDVKNNENKLYVEMNKYLEDVEKKSFKH
jgi:hypothetical protein